MIRNLIMTAFLGLTFAQAPALLAGNCCDCECCDHCEDSCDCDHCDHG